ncbi:DUF1638 domain-containing protein [Dehalobacterium formicoaceticum]|uniref:DUF1638 domain-containing protein n=1 Tax=Dehalobacterium formicoaceticum TaxID=51515 RepID=A0ABT1Y4G8_9FIRM|nr:DUF1638 domain-containing protein [Dehalobacterium formicoaceticum]MCR6545766.1 DUF1638 domain-containing protein [Dehalobacterium formicoaceticum]
MNKTRILACRTMEDEIMEILPQDIDSEFLEYGLHNTPDKLRLELQQKIDASENYDHLLFGYGLCSNGVVGLKTDRHTFVVPRVHDCISLLIGSKKQYDIEFDQYPATYYLSRGWIKQEGDPLSSYYKYRDQYGEENALWLIGEEYKNYQRVVYIHTVGDSAEYVKYSQEVADFLKVIHVEMQGSLSYFEKLLNQEWEEEFLVIPPGKTVTTNSFL